VNTARASELTHIGWIDNESEGPRVHGCATRVEVKPGQEKIENFEGERLGYGRVEAGAEAGVEVGFGVLKDGRCRLGALAFPDFAVDAGQQWERGLGAVQRSRDDAVDERAKHWDDYRSSHGCEYGTQECVRPTRTLLRALGRSDLLCPDYIVRAVEHRLGRRQRAEPFENFGVVLER